MDRYNHVRAKIYGINFFRIDVFHNNSLIPEDRFNKIKSQYDSINQNLNTIYENSIYWHRFACFCPKVSYENRQCRNNQNLYRRIFLTVHLYLLTLRDLRISEPVKTH